VTGAPETGSMGPGDIAAAASAVELTTTAIVMISVSILLLAILAMVASPAMRKPLSVLFGR